MHNGKTWVGCALGVAACNAFFSVRYVRLPEMLDDLCVKKDEEWAKVKKKYVKCDLLIIDDWMLEPLKDGEAREVLEIAEARNTRGSLMLCSQFGAGGWAKKLGGDAIAEAIVDRKCEASHLRSNVKSYVMRSSSTRSSLTWVGAPASFA